MGPSLHRAARFAFLLLMLRGPAGPRQAYGSDEGDEGADVDCKLLVMSPVAGATYSAEDAKVLSASLDIKFGEGPIADAVRWAS